MTIPKDELSALRAKQGAIGGKTVTPKKRAHLARIASKGGKTLTDKKREHLASIAAQGGKTMSDAPPRAFGLDRFQGWTNRHREEARTFAQGARRPLGEGRRRNQNLDPPTPKLGNVSLMASVAIGLSGVIFSETLTERAHEPRL